MVYRRQNRRDDDWYPLLPIDRMSISKTMGGVVGGDLVGLYSSYVSPEDEIAIYFYHLVGHTVVWQRFAEYVSVEKTIVFRVPGYITMDIDSEIIVHYEVIRPSDRARSIPIEYKFLPLEVLPAKYTLELSKQFISRYEENSITVDYHDMDTDQAELN